MIRTSNLNLQDNKGESKMKHLIKLPILYYLALFSQVAAFMYLSTIQ